MNSVYIGYDSREPIAFDVCAYSLTKWIARADTDIDYAVNRLDLAELRASGKYWRPTTESATSAPNGDLRTQLWDDISGAPMATEFAISRFLVPHLHGNNGWALFHDCDMLWRHYPDALFALADPQYAVMVVKHDYQPAGLLKMDGQHQTNYERKLWSSLMLFNCAHPANARLDIDLVNTVPGRDLHRFCWLKDEEIGELSPAWNWVPGRSDAAIDPHIVHYTEGGPWIEGFERCAWSSDWHCDRSCMDRMNVVA